MFYTKSYLRDLSRTGRKGTKTFSATVNESKNSMSFDIFLSHSYRDKEYIEGLFLELSSKGFKVYVDWIVDSHLDRKNVDKKTVALIRNRMKQSKSLIYATSENASTSKWMPWELGYMDGETSRCAILPITDYENSTFEGQEFLSVYPYVTKESVKGLVTGNISTEEILWLNENSRSYQSLKEWLR
jgi:hypothetical protein